MVKITAHALMLVSLRASVQYAFIPNTRPRPHAHQKYTRAFSTTLADSERDVYKSDFSYNDPIGAVTSDADAYADSMEELTQQILSEDDDVKWTLLTTNTILSALTYQSNLETVEGAETIQKILDRLEARIDSEEEISYQLHCGHYTIAVTAWSKSGHPEAAEKATEIVNHMKKRNINPNEVTYNTWMNAYVIKNDTSKVEEIIREMEEKIPDNIRVKDYNALILANARQGRAKEAEQIVKQMVEDYMSGKSYVLPDLISYSMLLEAWSKSNEDGRGERAESILDSIEERQISFDTTAYENPESTISAIYVAAMRAVIHSGEDNIIERVENIYQRIIECGIAPDAFVFSTLLDAYAITQPVDAAEKVPEILRRAQENIPDIDFEDQTVVYNTALKVLKESQDPRAATQAEKLFEIMKSKGIVDEVTYGTMIALHTNDSGNSDLSANRAEELLYEMNEEGDLEANTHHMNSAMNSLIRAGNLSKAADLLNEMEEQYKKGNKTMRPNVVSYSTLMNGWVKSNEDRKAEEAEAVFERMTSMFESGNKAAEPNFVSYVTLVDCIVKSGQAEAAERAESIVKNMYKSYKLGTADVKPNAQLVSTVIDCWSKSGQSSAGERAELLLDWLLEIYEEEKDSRLMPSAYSFTSAITAWGKSRKFGKATRAEAILNKMKLLFKSGVIKSPPNIYCYTAVINACAYTERDVIEKRDALQVFVKTYKEVIAIEDVAPNHITFATVLTALRNLLPAGEKRSAAVSTIFEKCIELGMCDHLVAKRLQSILNKDELKELVGIERVNNSGWVEIGRLPSEWTCNVPSSKGADRR